MTEQDERRNWRHIKISFIVIKITSCQIETRGLQRSMATIFNDFIIFLTCRIFSVFLVLWFNGGQFELN